MKTVLNCFQDVSDFFLMAQTLHKRHYRKSFPLILFNLAFIYYIKSPCIIHLEYENYYYTSLGHLTFLAQLKLHTRNPIYRKQTTPILDI